MPLSSRPELDLLPQEPPALGRTEFPLTALHSSEGGSKVVDVIAGSKSTPEREGVVQWRPQAFHPAARSANISGYGESDVSALDIGNCVDDVLNLAARVMVRQPCLTSKTNSQTSMPLTHLTTCTC